MYIVENDSPLFTELLELMKTIKNLKAVSSLLGWDQETYMPKGAYEHRADQLSTIDTISHELMCSEKAKTIAFSFVVVYFHQFFSKFFMSQLFLCSFWAIKH